jgi:hypothetical protein
MNYTNFSEIAVKIFNESILKYHILDQVDQSFQSSYPKDSLSNLLFKKNWIDTVQWHYEDLIRDPGINPKEGMLLKRKIDKSNQERTDLVEFIDDFFLTEFMNVKLKKNTTHNSESPAWAIDRLSILSLKIFHMQEQILREDTSIIHKNNCSAKLNILNLQKNDLSESIDELINDLQNGKKHMKVYKQMKMYNDDSLNPILYHKKDK